MKDLTGEKKIYTAAVVLAAGNGKRMGGSTKKQYMQINGKPAIYYSLKAFQESFIDEIVLVVPPGDVEYCRSEIVEACGFEKVRHLVEGGKERYHSVYRGLESIESCDYVFIHDGARTMLTQEILERSLACVRENDACVAGMPVKDTVKIADENKFIRETPNRKLVWTVQTPQTFSFPLIKEAYRKLIEQEEEILQKGIQVTDDAMAVELFTGHSVKLVEGSYENIKITTPEDISLAESFLKMI